MKYPLGPELTQFFPQLIGISKISYNTLCFFRHTIESPSIVARTEQQVQ